MTKREQVEEEFPSKDGWMWHQDFAKLVGVKQVLPGTRTAGGKLYERAGSPRFYRYRLIGDGTVDRTRGPQEGKKVYQFKPSNLCAGCTVQLTRNRTHIIAGVTVCRACARAVTVGGDRDLCEKLGI